MTKLFYHKDKIIFSMTNLFGIMTNQFVIMTIMSSQQIRIVLISIDATG